MSKPDQTKIVTRFAPSPTGWLHLGHAFAALQAFEFANTHNGRFLLRIEDTDHTRCRPEYEAAIFEDLKWIGLDWEETVRRQSEHLEVYRAYIADLTARSLTYPCFCSRKEILDANARRDLRTGPDGPLYPGTCRNLTDLERQARLQDGAEHVIRLDTAAALAQISGEIAFVEAGRGPQIPQGSTQAEPQLAGDIVLARKGSTTSYHASVVIDDHLQGITDVVRGIDLYSATHIHCLLQSLWGFEPPQYHHHALLLDDEGRKLSKRDKDHALTSMREAGTTVLDVQKMISDNLARQTTSH